jgi:hypothetical protein
MKRRKNKMARTNISWMQKAQLLEEYVRNFGKLPSYSETYNDYKIGTWLSNQRYRMKVGTLTQEQIRRLDEIDPNWSISPIPAKVQEPKVNVLNGIDLNNEYLQNNINELGLSKKLTTILNQNGIVTIKDFVMAENFDSINGVGVKFLQDIKDKIAELKETLKVSDNEKVEEDEDICELDETECLEETEAANVNDVDVEEPAEPTPEEHTVESTDTEDETTIEDPEERCNIPEEVEENKTHKYFVAFTYEINRLFAKTPKVGNCFVETPSKINSPDMIAGVTEFIEEKNKVTNVVIINYIEC